MNLSNHQHKIGFYIRVSTEEQAANPEGSIKNQEDRLRRQVDVGSHGDIVGVYVDRAKSGGNTKRPQLQRLLRDIRDQKVTLVMVTELSRLSRSVKDFTEMWELMNQKKCGFLSLREKFDTTTAAGEMLIMNLASFSQFERRQVSERVSANFLARAKRGLFNGGTIPIGYKQNPERKGYLIVEEDEVSLIQNCFKVYADKQSLQGAARQLNSMGLRLPRVRRGAGGTPRDGRFSLKNLNTILRNKSYVAIRAYKENGEPKETQAAWPAIVSEKLFFNVQSILDRNRKKRLKIQANGKRHPYILSSLVYCGQCGDKLTGKSAHGKTKKITYYEHGSAIKRASGAEKCSPFRIQAKILEPIVWERLVKLVTDPEFAKDIYSKLQTEKKEDPYKAEIKSLKSQISLLKRKIGTLTDHLSQIPTGVSATPIYQQMKVLGDQKEASELKLQTILDRKNYYGETLSYNDYKNFLSKLSRLFKKELKPEDQAKVARLLLAKVEIFEDHVQIFFNMDSSLAEDFDGVEEKSLTDVKKAHQTTNLDHLNAKNPDSKKISNRGSFCLTFGGDGET